MVCQMIFSLNHITSHLSSSGEALSSDWNGEVKAFFDDTDFLCGAKRAGKEPLGNLGSRGEVGSQEKPDRP